MPAPAMEDTIKNAKNDRIERENRNRVSWRRLVLAFCRAPRWSTRMRLCQMIDSTTGTPTSPTSRSVLRQPISTISAAVTGGAAAKPTWPTKVWIENERPIRLASTEPLRIA